VQEFTFKLIFVPEVPYGLHSFVMVQVYAEGELKFVKHN